MDFHPRRASDCSCGACSPICHTWLPGNCYFPDWSGASVCASQSTDSKFVRFAWNGYQGW
jgi:hypothetical protein